jgi:protein phosphatase 1 regulatory subunit 7
MSSSTDDFSNSSEPSSSPPPSHRIVTPGDVVPLSPNMTEIEYIGTRGIKVTLIDGLSQFFETLTVLVLRSNLLSSCSGVGALINLTTLELYDNQIESLDDIVTLSKLEILDVSCNRVHSLLPISKLKHLRSLFCASNRLSKIEGLEFLGDTLEQLDLGDNRISKIEGVKHLGKLNSLWIGKNRIELVKGFDNEEEGSLLLSELSPICNSLRQLDLQSNRISNLGTGLQGLLHLEELVLGHNGIESLVIMQNESTIQCLASQSKLSILDLTGNRIKMLGSGLDTLPHLTDLWLGYNQIANVADMDLPRLSRTCPQLNTLYLEHNPIARDWAYRIDITKGLSSLVQLDADLIKR